MKGELIDTTHKIHRIFKGLAIERRQVLHLVIEKTRTCDYRIKSPSSLSGLATRHYDSEY